MQVTITGGAGFVGANLARHFLASGNVVTVMDSGARKGSLDNLRWLREQSQSGDRLRFVDGDIRDPVRVLDAVREADVVFHLAAQVAVTTSVTDPVSDFEVNARGTLNVLEAVRNENPGAVVFYTSTNKVYGGLSDVSLKMMECRYNAIDYPQGIDESRPLEFHSPYGCSKGAADQYVQDYARIYELKTVTFRMSCIYGPLQNGNEDQGWVAHFARSFVEMQGLRIYGDGKQVRDILHVGDLARAFDMAWSQIGITSGKAYNIGGGAENSISLLELISMLRRKTGNDCALEFHDWRPGDQRWYVSNTEKALRDFGWTPKVTPEEGMDDLLAWVLRVTR